MSEELFSELGRRLVIGRKRDGRCVYDPQAKLELIRACRDSSLSVAKVARACGINANQLTTWMRKDERAQVATPRPSPLSFMPVRIESSAAAPPEQSTLDLQARLPNGVVIDLRGVEPRSVGEVIESLGRLRCSVSTKG